MYSEMAFAAFTRRLFSSLEVDDTLLQLSVVANQKSKLEDFLQADNFLAVN